MNNPDTAGTPPPKRQPVGLLLFLRWLLGGIAGYVAGVFLLILGYTGQPPLLGPIIVGQVEFFNNLFYWTSLDTFIESPPITFFGTSGFACSLLWGITGSLLASGRKRQMTSGMIFLILYLLLGGVYFIVWAFRMIPT
jgi:hypothetical protein